MKKSNNTHRPAERKKPTNAEISQNRARSQVRREQEHRKQKNLCWDDLHALHRECATLLTAAAPVAQLLRNKELLDAMGENITKLSKMAQALLSDVKDYRDRLDNIKAQHEGKTGGEDDATFLLTAYTIGEEYQQWILSYNTVVLSNIQGIMDLAQSCLPAEKKLQA